jgi:hypothetical protein
MQRLKIKMQLQFAYVATQMGLKEKNVFCVKMQCAAKAAALL